MPLRVEHGGVSVTYEVCFDVVPGESGRPATVLDDPTVWWRSCPSRYERRPELDALIDPAELLGYAKARDRDARSVADEARSDAARDERNRP